MNRFKNPLMALVLLLSSGAANAGEAGHGNYAPQLNLTEMPPQMQQMLTMNLPKFEFEQDTVKMIVAGKLKSTSPYQMDGLVAVVETDQGTKRVTFSDDYSWFTVNGGDGTAYTRQ